MEKKKIDKERRRDLRVGISRPFMIRFQIKKQKEIFNLWPKKIASAKNISVGGMFIELPALNQRQIDGIIEGKDKLILELVMPDIKRSIRVRGRITRLEKRDKYGEPIYVAGLSFEDIKEKDREEILHQLINMCLKKGYRLD